MDLLRLEGIRKSFGGVRALKGVSFTLRAGEVHALVGENGAGKSTLIKVLSGVYRPDEGEIVLDGERVLFSSPRHAQAAGIATIHQETSLFPDLSVLENLFMGRQPTRGGRIRWGVMRAEAEALLRRLNLQLPLNARLGDLGKARAQLVEIAKALLQRARLLILDEPTAALTQRDVRSLFVTLRELQTQGVSMIYISHRLEEIFEIAQQVTVLRDGEAVGWGRVAQIDQDWLIAKMVGRVHKALYPRTLRPPGRVLLDVQGLSQPGAFKDVSFRVHEGEIVALAGLVGSGRSEVARALFGIDPYASGTATLLGEPLPRNPRRAVRQGLAMVPEDRGKEGLIGALSVQQNLSLATLRLGTRLDFAREASRAREAIAELGIRPANGEMAARNLSGGNQQKVVIGKWLATQPKLLILDEPTQGVDVGAKAEIHRLMDALVAQGLGVLMISSELLEVLGMADRILVMRGGRIVAELPRGASQEDVMRAATGARAGAAVEAVA
ncbi:sugar ABC transporter ATP-binding protein [Truepera radiovictrix]|uniref:ABC transporter related protein n=1 Tax=Truepera radiovictrix (strain DSM 17093 / CIP 108686 / LMG 22925 / RQ-24) TaxID=649638 RepID=D7CW05_TRURR|nr:sugar ABC transporter ATP-binding protein [Truepera radiovictrix]ADI14268.1 ABC transporter related protein [Truepera radiovictrix DSM 17093]WMT57174.1 sugar ABC transporter ATP-binding protein [Truepera radiovictrix]